LTILPAVDGIWTLGVAALEQSALPAGFPGARMESPFSRQPWRYSIGLVLAVLLAAPVAGQFVPPQNLDPTSAAIQLDSSFQSDAWLVYTYDIDVSGQVVNAAIRSSNGVPEVEQAVLRQVNTLRFSPATRNGEPLRVSADPVIYTWILDKPREMSPGFERQYREAWALYSEGNYGAAADIARDLQDYPGRNALEEVKSRILAASLASRWQDDDAELRHLGRVVALQQLALDNNFRNRYIPSDQYLRILDRIVTLQLNAMMLADAGDTLLQMRRLGGDDGVIDGAGQRFVEAQRQFDAMPDVTVKGELVPLFEGGTGAWKAGLSRTDFSISDVRGRVGSVFLVCNDTEKQLRYPSQEPWSIPPGWTNCKIDIAGEAGTQLVLHQHAPG
jgi:TonB family protein